MQRRFERIGIAARMRISGIDYILGETRGVTRPSRVVTPTGNSLDMPADPPVAPADRTTLLGRVNLVRSTAGNRIDLGGSEPCANSPAPHGVAGPLDPISVLV